MILSPILALAGVLAKGGGITLDPIAKPLAAVLAFFYDLVPNYGIAIVLLTIAMMIVLTPLTIKQTRSMLVMQKLQPQLKRLQETHKNDRQALNEAVMALYKEHNASPLGGCLPMLLPLPVFFALLKVLEGLSRTIRGQSVPKYLHTGSKMFTDIVHAHGKLDAFGMDLAKSASNAGGTFAHKSPYFVLLLLMIGTQYYQQRQLTSRNPQAAQQPGQAMMKFLPLFFGLISIRFPAGVVIYWTVSNMVRIFQQWAMYRYDPKVKALVTQDVKEIEARTREIDAEQKTGRPRLRDLLSNAAGAAAAKNGDAKNPGGARGKNPPKPGNRPGGAKGAPPAKGGRTAPTSGKTPPAGGKAAGGGGARAGGAAGGKTAAGGGGSGSKAAGGGGGRGGSGGGSKVAGGGGGAKAASGGKAASGAKAASGGGSQEQKTTPSKPGAAETAPAKGATGANGGATQNQAPGGGTPKPAGAGGAASPGRDGADAAPAAPSGNGSGGAGKGRTGGSSSRSVSSRRRRRGR